MIMRRHKDIVAFKAGAGAPIAFHARNLEVAQISPEAWESMAPSTFSNPFSMNMESSEAGVDSTALLSLEDWHMDNNPEAYTKSFGNAVKTLTLNVTQICNLHCSYCAAGGDGTYGDPVAKISLEKTLPQLGYFIGKLKENDSFSIIFLGGEPLLYPEAVKHIADYTMQLCTERNVFASFTVITNGTLITEKTLDILCSIKAHITISIDGAPEEHDKARPQKNGKGSAEQAYKGLESLLSRRSELSEVLVHSVFSRYNLEVEKAYLYLSQFPVDKFEFTFDVTEADNEANHKFVAEMSKVAEIAFNKGGEAELRKISMFNAYFDALDSQRRTENYCGTGKSLLSIDSNNKVFACPLDVGRKNEQVGEGSTLDSEALNALNQNLVEKNNCQTCWARFLCGGGCLFVHKSLTGNKHKKHVSFCERTRSLIALTLLYYERSRG